MADIIKSRRDTAENWRTANPTLAEGELGFETDTKRYKLGDGKKAWNDLEYFDRDVDDEPTTGSENLVTSGGVAEQYGCYENNPEFIKVWLDGSNRILLGIRNDGEIVFGVGVPSSVKSYVDGKVKEINSTVNALLNDSDATKKTVNNIVDFLDGFVEGDTLKELLDKKVDGEYVENPEFVQIFTDSEGKILAGIKIDGTLYFPQNEMYHVASNPEWIEIELDADGKILSYRRKDGTKFEHSLEVEHFNLTPKGMTEFQKALKDAGFQPGGTGDWSDYISNGGDEPLQIPVPRFAKINIITDLPLENLNKIGLDGAVKGLNYDVPCQVEFFDMVGNYFKKPAMISGQGNSTMNDPMKSIALDLFDSEVGDDAFAVKFGDWVSQDSYHIKAFYKDCLKSIQPIAYTIGEKMTDFLKCRSNRNQSKISSITDNGGCGTAKYDWNIGAKCMPQQFPIEVFRNGEYYGLCVLSLKKHRANYSMDKKEYEDVLIDHIGSMTWIDDSPNWNAMEIRNPKTLICMDGSEYDGDSPKELIDSSAEGIYDASNKDHVNTAKTKNVILKANKSLLEVINAESVDDKKKIYKKYFDFENALCYAIFCELTYNIDGYINNCQVSIYSHKDEDGNTIPKIGFNIYDCDSCLGKSWSGTLWSMSTSSIVLSKSNNHPLRILPELFFDELKAAYKQLRDAKVIDYDSISEIVDDWIGRIGYDALVRQNNKWGSPSYSNSWNLNADNWKQIMWHKLTLPTWYSGN